MPEACSADGTQTRFGAWPWAVRVGSLRKGAAFCQRSARNPVSNWPCGRVQRSTRKDHEENQCARPCDPIHTDYIKLDSFLKLAGVCFTGGEAKELIAKGGVRVNAAVAAERGKKLRPGDKVTAAGKLFELQAKPLPQENLTAPEQADRL